jgi:hypothetical protein
MSFSSLIQLWNKFWFEPASPTPIALYRIILGVILLQDAVLMRLTDWRLYYSAHPIIPVNAFISFWWGRDPRFDILSLLPNKDISHLGFLLVYIVFLTGLTLGFRTRTCAVGALLVNESLFNQFLFNLSGADVFLKMSLMFVAVSNAGDAFSLDNLLRTWRQDWRKTGFRPPLKPQWALRMVQVQVTYVYFITSLCKLGDPKWVDGTVLYYVSRYEDLARIPLPYLYGNLLICKILTWMSLLFELVFPYLVWVKETRYLMLIWGTIFHIGVDITVNIPLFEWIFIGSYVTFVSASDLTRVMNFIKNIIRKVLGPPIILRFDDQSLLHLKLAGVLHRLDIFGRLAIEPLAMARATDNVRYTKASPPDDKLFNFKVIARGKELDSIEGLRAIFSNIPIGWLCVLITYLPITRWLVTRSFTSDALVSSWGSTTNPIRASLTNEKTV